MDWAIVKSGGLYGRGNITERAEGLCLDSAWTPLGVLLECRQTPKDSNPICGSVLNALQRQGEIESNKKHVHGNLY
jgi:hypothetical protein